MIKINVKGLAKFMLGDDAERRRVLTAFKFRDLGKPMAGYYREAIPAIRSCVMGQITRTQLINRAAAVTRETADATARARVRLNHNARAIVEFDETFGGRWIRGVPSRRLSYVQGNVNIAVHPELWVEERNELRIFKLELLTEPLSSNALTIMANLVYHAARQHEVEVTPRQIGIIELASGEVHGARRIGPRISQRISAALQNIEALWPTITRPVKRGVRAEAPHVIM